MKARILLSSAAAITLISLPAMAASRILTINDLAITNGRLTVQVPDGNGVVIDLSEIGQIVKSAGFGDPTKFVISGIDGQLCYMQQDACEATGASVIAFRPVKGIEISTQSHSPDGSTTATLITDGRLGRKVLHMRLVPAVKATYTAIVVRENPTPVLPAVASKTSTRSRPVSAHFSTANNLYFPLQGTQSQSAEQSTEKPASSPVIRSFPLISSTTQRSAANALAIGLSMANPSRNNSIKIEPQSVEYKKVQNAIIALRKGKTLEEAAEVSGLELQLIEQLIYLVHNANVPINY